jgi:hypothetical protein
MRKYLVRWIYNVECPTHQSHDNIRDFEIIFNIPLYNGIRILGVKFVVESCDLEENKL